MFCNNLKPKRLLQRGIDKWSYSQIGHQELSRLEVIQKVIKRELKQYIAAELLNISVRQVERLVFNYRINGALGIISKKRNKSSNHQILGKMG